MKGGNMSLKTRVRNFIQYLKFGGITEVKIATPMRLDSNHLENKVILIVGGTSGIGKAITNALSQSGAKTIITGRDQKRVDLVADSIENCKGIAWDITNYDLSDDMILKCKSIFGEIDVLVNCAGVFDKRLIEDVSVDEYDRIMGTNLKGMYFNTQAFIKHADPSQENKKKILNILSINSYISHSHPYALSKWAGLGLTKGLAKELYKKNIIVNAVAPGITVSGISEDNNRDPDGNLYYYGTRSHHMMRPEQIANVALFLISDFSEGIVGQVISVDDGDTLL